MRSALVSLAAATLLLTNAPLIAQSSPALGIFATVRGEWEGEAWMIRGPEGRVTVRQREWVATEAGGTVITVRGLGTFTADGKEQTIHSAFAVIHASADGSGLAMRAFTAEGRWIDPEIVRTERGYTWKMRDSRVGLIRYEMTLDENNRWIENGFFSRDDGATWSQFLGMVLTRK